jgi:hypothetical protein
MDGRNEQLWHRFPHYTNGGGRSLVLLGNEKNPKLGNQNQNRDLTPGIKTKTGK